MISATYSPNSVTVTFSDAKEKKAAFALLEELKAWHEANSPKSPTIARIATPSGLPVSDGPNLQAWQAETGTRFRTPSFAKELGWSETDREANAGKMLAMLQNGEIVRTVSGWKLANGTGGEITTRPDIEIDTDEVV